MEFPWNNRACMLPLRPTVAPFPWKHSGSTIPMKLSCNHHVSTMTAPLMHHTRPMEDPWKRQYSMEAPWKLHTAMEVPWKHHTTVPWKHHARTIPMEASCRHHGRAMLPWKSHGNTMLPWKCHGDTMLPWKRSPMETCFYGRSIEPPCFQGSPMGVPFPWKHRASTIPMDEACKHHGRTMEVPWKYHGPSRINHHGSRAEDQRG